MFNLPNLIFTSLFSLFGVAFFIYGKKTTDFAFLATGGLLMVYPYFVSGAWLVLTIGLLLTVAPFLAHHFGL